VKKNKYLYFDYAAATPLDDRVLGVMQPFFCDDFYNPSSPYQPARRVRKSVEDARVRIARLIGAKPDELYFTAGATEAINIIFHSVLSVQDAHVVSINTEHAAVLEVAKLHPHTLLAVDHQGRIVPEAVAAAITVATQLVSVSLVNNEIGTVHPIKAIAQIIHEVREQRRRDGVATPLYFHVDASQGLGMVDVHAGRMGIDAMTLNAAKVYGPKQLGVLWAKGTIARRSLIAGGGQEMGVRSGTENVPAIVGAAKAFELAESMRKNEVHRLTQLRNYFEKKLQEALPGVIIQGAKKHHIANIMTISFPGVDAERIIFALESRNILVATGAACAANKNTVSHVLTALGLSHEEIVGSIRISFGRATDEAAADTLVAALEEIVPREREYGIV
jgi:cysteine desulfurase